MTTEFKMVPVEPTEEMLYAASWVHGPGGMGEVKRRIDLEYRAALAAAPEPPKQDGIPDGVVLPEKYDESQYRGTSLLAVRRWNQCVDEVVRLNLAAAPASPQAAQPVAWQYRVSAGPQTGWSLWHDGKGEEFKDSYQVETRPLYTHADAGKVDLSAPSKPIYDETEELEKFSIHWKLEGRIYRDKNTRQWLPTRDTIEGFQMAERVHALWIGWQSCALSTTAKPEADHE